MDGAEGPHTERLSRRRFNYDRRLLPNEYLAMLEPGGFDRDPETGRPVTGQTIGYPAWNLLYYSLFSSLLPELEDLVVIETGTNIGASTIIMAQALKDLGVQATVKTVDKGELMDVATENVRRAGLEEFVEFNHQDSLEFLRELNERTDHIDFAFLDSDHSFEHVMKEVELVRPKVVLRGGKVYFDNTNSGGVAEALEVIEKRWGNLVRFENCSWGPPGNAIWQPAED